jgi:hypothetical protein
MFASMAVVLAWAGWIGWREWPKWRAVREMRAAVEANEPARFLDAIEQVDSLGVAESANGAARGMGDTPFADSWVCHADGDAADVALKGMTRLSVVYLRRS